MTPHRDHAPRGPEAPAETKVDENTRLSRQRSSLAVQRSFLASERTLMAWLRTSMSMISFGFTLAKIFEYLEDQRGGPLIGRLGRSWSPTTVGIAMVVIGTGALIFAIIQHRRRVHGLDREGLPAHWNLAQNVAVLVAILGIFAFGALFSGF